MKFWLFLFIILFGVFSHAKNLENRYGVGASLLEIKPLLPVISLRFIPEEHYSGIFDFGFDSNPNSPVITLGIRVLRYIILEENMNSFIGVGIYYLSKKNGNTENGASLKALIGHELFLPFFPNMAFQFETGFSCRAMTNTTSISILISAGLHYYFY